MFQTLIKYKIIGAVLLSLLFVVANMWLIIRFDFYWLLSLPLFIIIAYYFLFSYDKILWLTVLVTPFAINLREYFPVDYNLSLPTEPLLAALLLLFVFRFFTSYGYSKEILKHPVTIVLILQILWMFITAISSEYPLVSFKFLLVRLWFIVPFYFMLITILVDAKKMKQFFWMYAIPLAGVIFYTVSRHISYGLNEETGHWVMSPFYNDHTAYGAVLAMFIPFFVLYVFQFKDSRFKKIALLMLTILCLAIVLSYSRAAWISVAAAMAVFFVLKFKVNIKWVILLFFISISSFFYFQDDLVYMLQKNKQESSENMAEHVQSISNISSDASNLERINRWQAALRMFSERPVLGWGPGTYQFVYSPFQKAKEKTEISTNLGNQGSVHSEYLGPLSEMGLFGLLLLMLLLFYVFKTAILFYSNTTDQSLKFLCLASVLGLVTYFTHGMLNNFLETDKLAVPVYGMISIIVALDVFHKKNPEQQPRI